MFNIKNLNLIYPTLGSLSVVAARFVFNMLANLPNIFSGDPESSIIYTSLNKSLNTFIFDLSAGLLAGTVFDCLMNNFIEESQTGLEEVVTTIGPGPTNESEENQTPLNTEESSFVLK